MGKKKKKGKEIGNRLLAMEKNIWLAKTLISFSWKTPYPLPYLGVGGLYRLILLIRIFPRGKTIDAIDSEMWKPVQGQEVSSIKITEDIELRKRGRTLLINIMFQRIIQRPRTINSLSTLIGRHIVKKQYKILITFVTVAVLIDFFPSRSK